MQQTLRNWRAQDEADRGERSDVLSTDERARLRELERENRVLRQEREIVTRFRFIAEEAAESPVSLLCRCVGVTPAPLRLGQPATKPTIRREDARLAG